MGDFLLLGKPYLEAKHHITGWFASEKLDGVRCFWDGGISRGHDKNNVPWANCSKDQRYIKIPKATGLWSRYGHPIQAPDWFLDQLPKEQALDGELYIKGPRQHLLSVVKDLVPGPGWEKVGYWVFDIPSPSITHPRDCGKWTIRGGAMGELLRDYCSGKQFAVNVLKLRQLALDLPPEGVLRIIEQVRLPDTLSESRAKIEELLTTITSQGGEGLVLRSPYSLWEPARSNNVLKVKLVDDSEGIVTGYIGGKGKYEGMIGAFVLRLPSGKRLELSGFTDAERYAVIKLAPGQESQEPCSQVFPLGSKVTFKYRGCSVDGIPQEARYWRKWHEV